jgi:hypothetical protein
MYLPARHARLLFRPENGPRATGLSIVDCNACSTRPCHAPSAQADVELAGIFTYCRRAVCWNRIPQARRDDLIEFALEHEALTTRELAVKYTDEKRYFISESSTYRFLKETDLITAPAHVVIKAADEFTDKTTAINQMLLSAMQTSPVGQWADRLHLLQDHRLGLVLPQHDPGRLQPLYHRLEALHEHAGRGRDRDNRAGSRSVRL